MQHTDDIKDLVASLAKAQGTIKAAKFNKKNPHFKSNYADFNSCMDACRQSLSENGLAISQSCELINERYYIETMLSHISGQWIKSLLPIYLSKMDNQGVGSAVTYGKRYALCALLGLVADQDDDDAEYEQDRDKENKKEEPKKVEEPKKILGTKLRVLKDIEERLDKENKERFNIWIKSCYKVDDISEIQDQYFEKVAITLGQALTLTETNKKADQ